MGVVFVLFPVIAFMLKRSAGVDLAARQLRSVRLWASVLLPTIIFFALRSVVMYYSGASDNFLDKLGGLSFVAAVLGIGQSLIRTCLPIPQGAYTYILATDLVSWLAVIAHVALILLLVFKSRRSAGLSLVPIGLILGIVLSEYGLQR